MTFMNKPIILVLTTCLLGFFQMALAMEEITVSGMKRKASHSFPDEMTPKKERNISIRSRPFEENQRILDWMAMPNEIWQQVLGRHEDKLNIRLVSGKFRSVWDSGIQHFNPRKIKNVIWWFLYLL